MYYRSCGLNRLNRQKCPTLLSQLELLELLNSQLQNCLVKPLCASLDPEFPNLEVSFPMLIGTQRFRVEMQVLTE